MGKTQPYAPGTDPQSISIRLAQSPDWSPGVTSSTSRPQVHLVKYDAHVSRGTASAAIRTHNYLRAYVTSISSGYAHYVIFGRQIRDNCAVVDFRAGARRRADKQGVKLSSLFQVEKRCA